MKQRKRLLKIIMPIIAIICSLIFIPWIIVRAWLTPLPDTIQEQANNAINYKLDGIIVYVDQSGKPPAFYTAGWKNKENKVSADPQALFKIASISKLYIAAATTKLINSQSLSLNDTLAKLLPELANRIENANRISLRMLLQHRSGIPDWIDDPEFPWDKPPTDVDKVLQLVLDEHSKFKPDSRYKYSNTNYLLIGKILDKILGYSHQQYIKNEILEHLSLTHTFSLMSEVDTADIVSGYDSHYDKDVKMLDFVSPGSSMVSTAQDVGIFLRALNDGSLLNKEEQTLFSSIYMYEHTGLLPGYQSIARYHKDIDAVVIQFVNTSGENTWTISEIVYNRIVKILRRKT
ncbi:serine hydrolase [Terrimonas sp.]|uniref:serine hydrolase domain-containing protein n=1 Tax=Terrimonas sp. TaxID=1914338 RepID=UPI000D521815|nr:serine hydrolase domain-containing protein [Terrimonas sp.]PVD49373.1 serine hydrolase [Terrimonas sp.]